MVCRERAPDPFLTHWTNGWGCSFLFHPFERLPRLVRAWNRARRVGRGMPSEDRTTRNAPAVAALIAVALLPALLTVYFSFQSGGYFPGAPALVAAQLALLVALRIAIGRRPLEGVSAGAARRHRRAQLLRGVGARVNGMVGFAGAGGSRVRPRARVPARARAVREPPVLGAPGALDGVCARRRDLRSLRGGVPVSHDAGPDQRHRRAAAEPPLLSARLLEHARPARRARRDPLRAPRLCLARPLDGSRGRRGGDPAPHSHALLHVLARRDLGDARRRRGVRRRGPAARPPRGRARHGAADDRRADGDQPGERADVEAAGSRPTRSPRATGPRSSCSVACWRPAPFAP